MATYRTVSLSFWTDSKVDDEFTPEDKYFYLYLLTNPHTNLCGCYEISMRQMVRETGYNEDTVKRLIDRMERVHDVIRYDPETKEVFIPRWGKYNWRNSKDVRMGVARNASYIKSKAFRQAFVEMGFIDDGGMMGTSWGDDGGISVSDTDTVSDTVTDISLIPTSKISKKKYPTLDEVSEYATTANLDVDPDSFYTFFNTPNNDGEIWVDSHGNKVKNWKQKMQTWSRMGSAPRKKAPESRYDNLRRLMEEVKNE